MSFATPSSLAEFSAHFENAIIAKSSRIDQPYYYEGPTNTINFGYGINLTAAAANPKVKAVVDQALRAEGISLTDAQWAAIRNPNGDTTATSLNNALPTNGGAAQDWKPAAANLKEAFYTQIVVPELTAKIPNLSSLPLSTQWALEDAFYNGPGLIGSNIRQAAADGNLARIAIEFAFDTSRLGNAGDHEEVWGGCDRAAHFVSSAPWKNRQREAV